MTVPKALHGALEHPQAMLGSVSIHSPKVSMGAAYQRGLDPVVASDRKLGAGFSNISLYQTMCFDTHKEPTRSLPGDRPHYLEAANSPLDRRQGRADWQYDHSQ